MKITLPSLIFFFSTLVLGENGKSVFFIGHSLVNHNMPRMVDGIAQSMGKTNHTWERMIGGGAPLKFLWKNSSKSEGVDARVDIPRNGYDVVIMTEAVPLLNHIQYSDSFNNAYNFHKLSVDANSNVQTYLYETWHCINSGLPAGCDWDKNDTEPWRTRLDTSLENWESIADSVNSNNYGTDMYLVPGGQALAKLTDSINSGYVTELSSISDVFSDTIHLNDTGWYFIACVQYATIYGESPVGASARIKNKWGKLYDIPYSNTSLITKLQEIAWETVSSYPESGVRALKTINHD